MSDTEFERMCKLILDRFKKEKEKETEDEPKKSTKTDNKNIK